MSMFGRSGNPTMRVFNEPQRWSDLNPAAAKPTTMTVGGVAQTTGLLLGIVFVGAIASAVFALNLAYTQMDFILFGGICMLNYIYKNLVHYGA